MSQVIEVLLKRLEVQENGESGKGDAASLLSFSLAYPNVTTPQRTTVKALKLADKTTIDYQKDLNPATKQPYTYTDRIVFKEIVMGRTELSVSLATVLKTPKFGKFLVSVFGAIFGAAWKLATGGIANALLGAVVETTGATHVTSLAIDDERSRPLGEALLAIAEYKIPNGPQLVLVAPETLTIKRWERPVPGQPAELVTRTILKKGDENGFVELEIIVT